MFRITKEYLCEIHRYAIDSGDRDEFSLRDAVLNEGTLDHIANKANEYEDNIERAAFLLYSISNFHPFIEGNKRTALLLAELSLDSEYIDAEEIEIDKFVRTVASGKIELEDVVIWIKENKSSINDLII